MDISNKVKEKLIEVAELLNLDGERSTKSRTLYPAKVNVEFTVFPYAPSHDLKIDLRIPFDENSEVHKSYRLSMLNPKDKSKNQK